jgi:hypothetical protein
VQPALANRDDAGQGEVELGKCRITPLQWQVEREEGCGFSYLFESHMTYLASSHILRSWQGIQLNKVQYHKF